MTKTRTINLKPGEIININVNGGTALRAMISADGEYLLLHENTGWIGIDSGYRATREIYDALDEAETAEAEDNDVYRDASTSRIGADYWINDAGEYRLG